VLRVALPAPKGRRPVRRPVSFAGEQSTEGHRWSPCGFVQTSRPRPPPDAKPVAKSAQSGGSTYRPRGRKRPAREVSTSTEGRPTKTASGGGHEWTHRLPTVPLRICTDLAATTPSGREACSKFRPVGRLDVQTSRPQAACAASLYIYRRETDQTGSRCARVDTPGCPRRSRSAGCGVVGVTRLSCNDPECWTPPSEPDRL
jgi:hypothetical protein